MEDLFKAIGTVIIEIIIFVGGFFTGCFWFCNEIWKDIKFKNNKALLKYRQGVQYGKSNRCIHDLPVFENKDDANSVLTQMRNILNDYGSVSVLEMYDLSGLEGEYKYSKYGWTDLSNAKVGVTRMDCIRKYYIRLPDAIRIDD